MRILKVITKRTLFSSLARLSHQALHVFNILLLLALLLFLLPLLLLLLLLLPLL